MAAKPLPSADFLRQLFDYCPDTGILTWRHRDLSTFPHNLEGQAKAWNRKYAGKVAGDAQKNFVLLTLNWRKFLAHRVIWKIMTGEDPPEVIDHVNGEPTDNRWSNLRACSQMENMRNVKVRSDNTTGYHGIYPMARSPGYYVRIGGKYIGTFPTLKEAYKARKRAERLQGYHKNHGRRAS